MKGFVIAAASSNSGKTTITMGLLRALRNRGLKVQPFKCGPDYIDPMFHSMASGNESVNLDTWMSDEEQVRETFRTYSNGADISVVEGVMGLYDGYDKWHGSSGEIAMLLDMPVILVINAKSAAYSVAPLIYGFKNYKIPQPTDPPQPSLQGGSLKDDCSPHCRSEYLSPLPVGRAGVGPLGPVGLSVIFNMVSSESHYQYLKEACDDIGVPCLGYVAKNPDLVVPSRHLGLTITAKEETERLIQLAAEEVEKHVDIDKLLQNEAPHPTKGAAIQHKEKKSNTPLNIHSKGCALFTPHLGDGGLLIAIAHDEAFNFTYRHNIDVLKTMGEVRFFSPMRDEVLPECDLLYLPGGYPELFADTLAKNERMRQSIKEYAERGGHIYAECGGFMYLCRCIDDAPMCGVFPFEATMEGAHLHLGYRMMERDGHIIKGHEFHYSCIKPIAEMPEDITIEQGQRSAKGTPVDTAIYHYKNVTAGYTHWYF